VDFASTPEGRIADIQHGWDVYGSDEEKVGNVSEVRNNYIVAHKGFFFPKDLYIPTAAISRIEHDRVYLNVAKADVDNQGWDAYPDQGGTVPTTGMTGAETTREEIPDAIGTPGLTGTTDEGGQTVRAGATDTAAMGEKGWDTAERRTETAGRRGDTDNTMYLHEEELQVNKQRQQSGAARIGKEVVEEQQTINVPVTREEAYVERIPGDRQPDSHTLDESAGEKISVPLSEEKVNVEKVPVTTEEVRVGKREVTENRQVSDTVRREEARIENEGDARIKGDADTTDRGKR
jgi:uncharacterized protein (TIGR02271 family)